MSDELKFFQSKESKNLNHEDFFKQAIMALRDVTKSRGIHSVYSGFNDAFRQYFGENPIPITQELAKRGVIEIQPRKGGVMIYLPGEAPKSRNQVGKEALSKILHENKGDSEDVFKRVIDEILPADNTRRPDDCK